MGCSPGALRPCSASSDGTARVRFAAGPPTTHGYTGSRRHWSSASSRCGPVVNSCIVASGEAPGMPPRHLACRPAAARTSHLKAPHPSKCENPAPLKAPTQQYFRPSAKLARSLLRTQPPAAPPPPIGEVGLARRGHASRASHPPAPPPCLSEGRRPRRGGLAKNIMWQTRFIPRLSRRPRAQGMGHRGGILLLSTQGHALARAATPPAYHLLFPRP